MDALPNSIAVIGRSLKRLRVFTRSDAKTVLSDRRRLQEKDFDRLFIENLDVLEDLLREGELIDATSKLRLLGRLCQASLGELRNRSAT